MNGLIAFVRSIGPARLAAMGAVAVGLVGFFVFIMMRLSEPQMSILYTDMTLNDSGAVVRELESRNVPYSLRNDGATVLVPDEQVLRLRLALAEQGLPEGGAVGYEIFDKGETLGATSFVQNINHLRALEGELARTIRALDKVQIARVHLVLPQRQLFSRDQADPSASIVLRVRGDLDKAQTRAIQHLVASAVKDLKPSRVAIVDENGRLLASGDGDETGPALYGTLEERNAAFEQRLEQRIGEIVTSVVGPNRARVQVTAEIDYNRITQTSDTFDPESQVVRSTQTREETSNSVENGNNDAVTVGNELPGAGNNQTETEQNTEAVSKTEETVNYEISRTTKTEVREAGRIKRISVAVLVDGVYTDGANGQPAYAPRPQDQLDQISALVRSAIGFNQDRGDQVEIVNLRFAPEAQVDPLTDADAPLLDLSKSDYFYIAELATLLIVSLLVLLFVVRPLVRRIVTPEEMPDQLGPAQARLAGPDGAAGQDGAVAQLTGPSGETIAVSEDGTPLLPTRETATSNMIDATQAIGSMHETSLKKVGDLVEQNPEEAIAIVRQWLGEEAA
ncbi:MAG: flagellar basal-body MS-ring/collar protein FliF [Hyphomicrobiales bacterium]